MFSAVAAKLSSGGSASVLPPLNFPLKGIELPPSLTDHVEPKSTKITTLSNGIKIASETSSTPVGLYVKSGSIYETPASFGATHTFNRSHLWVVREVEAIGDGLCFQGAHGLHVRCPESLCSSNGRATS